MGFVERVAWLRWSDAGTAPAEPRDARIGHPSQSKKHGPRRPASPAELAALIGEARAALDAVPQGGLRQVDQMLVGGGEEGLTDAQIKRWLAARGWDPVRTAHDLAAHAAWRVERCPHGRVLESEIAEQIAQQKVMVQGLDHHGRPVAILVGGNHIPRPDHTEVQGIFCYAADACIATADPVRNPEGHVVFIIDVGEFGWKNFDLLGAKTLFSMMHAHYVERLSTVYIHNASTIVMQLYKMVAPFIDPVTRGKIVFLPHDPQEAAAILAQDIDISLLPPNLGGSSPPRPVEQVWAELLTARESEAASPQTPLAAASSPSRASTCSMLSCEGGGCEAASGDDGAGESAQGQGHADAPRQP